MNFNKKTPGTLYFFDHRDRRRVNLRVLIQKGSANTIRCTSISVEAFSKAESMTIDAKIEFEATDVEDEDEL